MKSIENNDDYCAALDRIELLFDAELGTPEGDELKRLAILVEQYEDIEWDRYLEEMREEQ